MSKLTSIFSECEVWENTPIGELFGQNSVNVNQKIRRVIVYGATQMGKTTMIMNLIGIKDDKKSELSAALRGMAAQGNSSTSTPIIYNRWDKNCFGIAMGDEMNETEGTLKEYSSKNDFIKAISFINDQQRSVGQTETSTNNVRYYYIPKDFFNEEKAHQDLQIIDLPGFGEKNAYMYEKAEEIIQRLINFVVGAVVVIKADKIVNLENEYKHFLKKNHTNHLAIVITHALSVDSELKRQISEKKDYFVKCQTANDFADAILKYFYDKLTDEKTGYLSKKKYPIEVIFPVEKCDEIRKAFPRIPELADAFDIILQRLINRMEAMKNTTSINACIEKLQETAELIDDNLEDEENSIKEFEKAKIKIEKENIENTNSIKAKTQTSKKLHQEITKIENDAKVISKKISNLSEKAFDNVGDCIYKDLIRWYVDDDKLFDEFERFFTDTFKRVDTPLKKGFDAMIKHTISNMDFCEVTKKRFFYDNAVASIQALFKTIQMKLCGGNFFFDSGEGELNKLLDKNKSQETKIVQAELKEIDKSLLSLNEVQEIYKKQIDEVSSKITSCNDNIKQLKKRKKVISKNKADVINIFADHFLEKEKNLLKRMEKESDPEATTALFLTYSAIYLNIKPYLEEKDFE